MCTCDEQPVREKERTALYEAIGRGGNKNKEKKKRDGKNRASCKWR